ncbi:hypothetical protein [Pseudomonas sp. Marseille-Q5115]|uniref:hypothetical protein n=1 Tax=Pseudomonas sp. Marseille-Q5115 TaxID=2866593 RepID=UPI001CE49555|nr:hypothetical protein [Pseudomonas sp. Marseille-Q5115]
MIRTLPGLAVVYWSFEARPDLIHINQRIFENQTRAVDCRVGNAGSLPLHSFLLICGAAIFFSNAGLRWA